MLRLVRCRQTLESTTENDHEASLFDVEPGTAMIVLEGLTCLEQDQPVEYFMALYRGNRFKFELESYRNGLSLLQDTLATPHISVALGLK